MDKCHRSAVIDVELAAEVERDVRLRLGASAVGEWAGQGSLCAMLRHARMVANREDSSLSIEDWALSTEDCDALSLWHSHASRVAQIGGDGMVGTHFGVQPRRALGLPPKRRGGTSIGIDSDVTQSRGLCYEAAVVLQLINRCINNKQNDVRSLDVDAEMDAAAAEACGIPEEVLLHPIGLLGEKDPQAGISAIKDVRLLDDIEEATSWNQVFAPSLGPLFEFAYASAEEGHLQDSGIRLLVVAPCALSAARLSPHLVSLPSQGEADDFWPPTSNLANLVIYAVFIKM